jgi:hypothetical protein
MPQKAPYPPPLDTPRPSWLTLVGEDGDGAGPEGETPSTSPTSTGPLPGNGWPKLESVDYCIKLITLIVLLLALPWLVAKLVSEPGRASRHAGAFVLGNSATE